MATQIQTIPTTKPLWQRSLKTVLVCLALVIIYACLRFIPIETSSFPKEWNIGLRQPVDQLQKWVIANRSTHPIFLSIFVPLSASIDFGMRWAERILLNTSWVGIITLISMLGYALSGFRLAFLSAIMLLLCGLFGLWEQSMQTMALMLISVLCALMVGIPLGIFAGCYRSVDRVVRPILDAMQTLPAFVYLIPLLLLFGVGRVPAVVATVIYAIPPVVRLTSLGIQQVSTSAVEAGRAFGSTGGQLLFKVQLPLAMPAIMTGINQTIMMALSMVVIAALIGAGGLGREVMMALDKLEVGKGFQAGLAIVFLAVILDRLSAALSQIDPLAEPIPLEQRVPRWLPSKLEPLFLVVGGAFERVISLPAELLCHFVQHKDWRRLIRRSTNLLSGLCVVLIVFGLTALMLPQNSFPKEWRLDVATPVNALVAWMKVNLYQIGDLPIGTGPFSDLLTLYLLNPMRTLLRDMLPWPVIIAAAAALGFYAGGWRIALLSVFSLLMIGLLGMWEHSMDTLSQVLITVICAFAIAFPLGILSSQSERFAAFLRPILDFLQTIPTFVYLTPVIMLFNVGRVPGLIAAALYAIPPGIRLTSLGLRQVDAAMLEAARAFGSTRRQLLFKVQLPMALPSIMLGVNQMIMMVLAMVIIAGLVGSGALGLEVVTGLRRIQTGRGLEAGLAIVFLAIMLDRITQAWAKRQSEL
jgi:glycine betaine/proline transport system permease protein